MFAAGDDGTPGEVAGRLVATVSAVRGAGDWETGSFGAREAALADATGFSVAFCCFAGMGRVCAKRFF
jgi:hypothetical protein